MAIFAVCRKFIVFHKITFNRTHGRWIHVYSIGAAPVAVNLNGFVCAVCSELLINSAPQWSLTLVSIQSMCPTAHRAAHIETLSRTSEQEN